MIVRQFRILCLHSDRCLRTELGNILQTQSSYSVVPVSNIQTANETYIDSSGNQVILVTNPENKDQQLLEEEEQTYYILHEDGNTYRATTTEVKADDNNLILIDDEEEEVQEEIEEVDDPSIIEDDHDGESEIVLSDVIDPNEHGKRIKHSDLNSKRRKRTCTTETSNNNSPEFQFVDINEGAQITNDDNLIEILEEEEENSTVDMKMKMCSKCASPYETTLLDHNLVCSSNYRDCQFCGLSELNVLQFDKHITEMHIKEYRVCPKCRHVFLEERHFLHHKCKQLIESDFDVNNYTCAFCLSSFNNLQAFTHHYYKEHHKKTNCICNKFI